MSRQEFASVCVHFAELEDPRSLRTQRHPLINVVVIGLCAVICGCSHFTQFEAFGKAKRDWFGKFLDLSNGIPLSVPVRNGAISPARNGATSRRAFRRRKFPSLYAEGSCGDEMRRSHR